jgi:hypothetical protein
MSTGFIIVLDTVGQLGVWTVPPSSAGTLTRLLLRRLATDRSRSQRLHTTVEYSITYHAPFMSAPLMGGATVRPPLDWRERTMTRNTPHRPCSRGNQAGGRLERRQSFPILPLSVETCIPFHVTIVLRIGP